MYKTNTDFTDDSGELLFGLGTSQIASLGRRLPFKNAVKLFRTAFENNINIIDTASSYGSGDSEYLIGKVLEELNAEPFIITKAGFPYFSASSLISPLNQFVKKAKEKLYFKKKYSSEYLINTLNKSLKRLRKKQVAAFLLHEPTAEELNSTNCWETLANIKKTGLAFFTGVSANDIEVVKEGIESGQVSIVQTSVQLGNENCSKIMDLCRMNKIPVIANEIFKPFNFGMYNVENTLSEVKLLHGLSQISAHQLLIGVTYLETRVKCILMGTRNEEHLIQNINSGNFFHAIEQNVVSIKKILSANRR